MIYVFLLLHDVRTTITSWLVCYDYFMTYVLLLFHDVRAIVIYYQIKYTNITLHVV